MTEKELTRHNCDDIRQPSTPVIEHTLRPTGKRMRTLSMNEVVSALCIVQFLERLRKVACEVRGMCTAASAT
jgi:hypothetical protein